MRTTLNMMHAAALLTAMLGGCATKSAPPAAAEDGERSHDFIRLEPGSPRKSFLKVEVVEETDAAPSVNLTGRVTFDEDHTQRVAAPIDGRATAILVKLGQKVRVGQPLVELSSPHVGQIQAEAQKAQQDVNVAQKGVERAHKLQQDGAISEKEAAQVEADFRKAKADVARAYAQLKSLSISDSDPRVTAALHAEVAGSVVERNVLVGQEVRADAATPLMTITNLDIVWVQADVYEQDLGLVHEGEAVNVRVPAYPGETFPGKVGHVGDVVDPTSRTVKMRCVVDNPGDRLKPEMFAKIELSDAAGKKAMLIPSMAVLNDSEHPRVIVATDDNVFRPRAVEVGPEIEGKVRVLSGLRVGEKIVTAGAIFLKREMESH